MHPCRAPSQRPALAACPTLGPYNRLLQGYSLPRSRCFRTRERATQQRQALHGSARVISAKSASSNGSQLVSTKRAAVSEKEGPSNDFGVIWSRLWKV